MGFLCLIEAVLSPKGDIRLAILVAACSANHLAPDGSLGQRSITCQ